MTKEFGLLGVVLMRACFVVLTLSYTYTPPPARTFTHTPPHTRASPKLANWAINLLAPTQLYKIMFNLEKAHFILDEMVQNGTIFETNKQNVLTVRRQNSTERGQNKKM